MGMTGAGKSEVARIFQESGYSRVRFGDVTDEELKDRDLELTEENERPVREAFRKKLGMAAYAILNLPKIDAALKTSDVVVDGLYSWEEYTYLKSHYGDNLIIVAVASSPETRYARLANRKVRPLGSNAAAGRDHVEIVNINKGGPIAMADFTILNDASMDIMKKQVVEIIRRLK